MTQPDADGWYHYPLIAVHLSREDWDLVAEAVRFVPTLPMDDMTRILSAINRALVADGVA